jgi:hypothetical protein
VQLLYVQILTDAPQDECEGKERYKRWKQNYGVPTIFQHMTTWLRISQIAALVQVCKKIQQVRKKILFNVHITVVHAVLQQINDPWNDAAVWKERACRVLKIQRKLPEYSWRETFMVVGSVPFKLRTETFPQLYEKKYVFFSACDCATGHVSYYLS